MGTFPQVTSGTESSSGLHEWTGWLQSVSLSTMQVCELLVCINRQVWVEGMGQSMNCVHDICDEAQKHRWPHAPTLNRLCMLCYLIFIKQMAPKIHRPLSGPQGACPSDQREADSFPGHSCSSPPAALQHGLPLTQMRRQWYLTVFFCLI